MSESDPLFALFLEASAALTGYDVFDLRGTGVASVYYETVKAAGERELRALCALVCDPATGRPRSEDEIRAAITAGGVMNPLAESVIELWYLGTWNGNVVSAQAYVEGLVWPAVGAHPQAAKAQGFGAWAERPQAGIH